MRINGRDAAADAIKKGSVAVYAEELPDGFVRCGNPDCDKIIHSDLRYCPFCNHPNSDD